MDGTLSSFSFDLDSVDKRKAFVEMIAASKISIGCLKNFERVFTSSVKALSREIVEGEIEDLYKEKRDRVKQELVMVPGRICLTVGIWADIWEMNSNRKFICITSRWFDNDWVVQERILEFRAFLHPYYPKDMDQWLYDWGIDRKLLGMCFDDESHQSLGFADCLRRRVLISDEYGAASFLNIQCFDNLLDSILQISVQCIEPIVEKIRSAISYILGQSHHKVEEFYELAKRSYKLDVTEKLICDFHGGWNSTYVMLDRALVYKNALLDWGTRDEVFKEEFSLGDDEWEKVGTLLTKFLRRLYRAIIDFSETKCVTSNMFLRSISLMYLLILLISGEPGSHHDFMGGVIKDVGEKLCKYFLDNSSVLSCAVILDPHCKEQVAEFCYRLLCRGFDERVVKEYVNRDVAALHRLFHEYNQKFSYLSSHENDQLGSELDRYLKEKISDDPNIEKGVSVDHKFDTLEYWKKTSSTNRYPVLAMLARDILGIPVSSSFLPGSEEADFYMVGKKKVTLLMGEPRTHEDLHVRTCLANWCHAP